MDLRSESRSAPTTTVCARSSVTDEDSMSDHGFDGVPTAAEVLLDLVDAGLVRGSGELTPLS